MNEIRIDQLPMSRGNAVAGSAKHVFERREIDPNRFYKLKRRTGSVRTARRGRSLGIVCDGTQRAFWRINSPITFNASGFSIGFSLRLGDITAAAGYFPICAVYRGTTLGGVGNEAFRLQLWRNGASLYLVIDAYDSGVNSVINASQALTVDGDLDIVFSFDASNNQIKLDAQGAASIAITGATVGFSFNASNYVVDFLGNELTGPDSSTIKAQALPPCVSNIAVWTTYQATPSAIWANRSPASPVHYYPLDTGGLTVMNEGSATAPLIAHPAAPEVINDLLWFNGESSAVRVELVPEIEQLFATALRSVASTTFTFFVQGTRRRLSARQEYLIDFGDLCKLRFNTSDQVEFVYNGTTVTTTTETVTADEAFQIWVGRNGTELFVRLITVATDIASNTSSDHNAPYVDLSRVPKLWIGAEDAPEADTKFNGTISKLALHRVDARRDRGPDETAVFYFSAADNESRYTLKDSGQLNVGLIPTIQSTLSAFPSYAPGPIDDAEFTAIIGGEAAAAGEVYGYDTNDQRFGEAIGTDAVGYRFGPRVIVTSADRAHVINTELNTVRPYGVPVPTADVSRLPTSVGLLSGVFCYGYRWATRDGTHGPIRRLDAVSTNGLARILLGSSSESGQDLDTELGETFGRTEGDQSTPAAADASRFRLITASGTPFTAGGDHVVGLQARLPDWDADEVEELIWHRGIKRATGTTAAGNRAYLWTKQTSIGLNVDQNWTLQASFRYKTALSEAAAMKGQCIVGICKSGAPVSGTTSQNNAAFAAYITEGCTYYSDTAYGGARTAYGTSANPRLVCCIARQEWNQVYGDWPNQPVSNYFTLTFTDDTSTWIDGNDYSVFFQRDGNALNVYVYNATTGVWSTLTANTMDAHASTTAYGPKTLAARSSYTGSTFFTAWHSPHSVHDVVWGASNADRIVVPFMNADGGANNGQPDQSAYTDTSGGAVANFPSFSANYPVMKACGADIVHYHYRLWQRALPLNEAKLHHEKRFAGFASEPLNYKIILDTGALIEDENNTDEIPDGKASVTWFGTEGRNIQSFKHFRQDSATLSPGEQDMLVLATNGAAITAAKLRLYVSPLGDGRLVLDAGGEGRYVLTKRLFNRQAVNLFIKKFEDFDSVVNEYDEFNWFHFALATDDGGGTTRLLRVKAMAINGLAIWTAPIGGSANSIATWNTGWGHLGGYPDASTINNFRVDVAELRIYADGEGPDVENGQNFEYMDSRLPSSEYANTLFYVKFQPIDTYNGGDGKASGATKLYHYGTQADELDLLETGDEAFIYDTRTESQGGTNPLPQVGFPAAAPRPDIVAIEVFRTQGVPVEDFDDSEEVQKALAAAFGEPLYFLARLPIGATHYIDNLPDGILGFVLQDETFSVPPELKQVFEWQGQLGVLGPDRRIFFAEAGPSGWETFPARLTYDVRVVEGGSDATAVRSTGDTLYVFGKDWCTAVTGGPGSESEFSVGGGAGAYSARATTNMLGKVFAFNGRLWQIDRTGEVDFQVDELGGAELQDLLPTHSNVRLVVSQALMSLLLIDETTGDVMRFSLVTGGWSIESRDAVCAGDLEGGSDGWITRDGAYAQGSTSIYSDDAGGASMTASATGTIAIAGPTVTLSGAPTTVGVGLRCAVEDAAGAIVEARVTDVTGAVVTFDSLAGLANGAGTVYFGAGIEGMLLDTGYLNIPGMEHGVFLDKVYLEVRAGAGWKVGMVAAPVPEDWTSRSDLQFASVTTATIPSVGQGARGKFIRTALRNRIPEDAEVSYASVWFRTATPGGKKG